MSELSPSASDIARESISEDRKLFEGRRHFFGEINYIGDNR